MKKLILFLFVVLVSCDYILKNQEDKVVKEDTKPELGIALAKDEKGCFEEAGYKWSIIKDSCIRVVDEGFRLNKINDLANLEPTKSAYVLFDEMQLQAEVFLQDSLNAIYFTRKNDSVDFIQKSYKLVIKSGYSLAFNDSIIYKAAETAIKPILGSSISDK